MKPWQPGKRVITAMDGDTRPLIKPEPHRIRWVFDRTLTGKDRELYLMDLELLAIMESIKSK